MMDGQIQEIPADEKLRGRGEPTKAEDQLYALRTAIDSLCFIGDLEPANRVTAVTQRLLRAMTPLRNLEALLVRTVEAEHITAHVKSSEPTPGMLVKGGGP